jgi:guanosine-3',5'-bis(diphosphate) 3'-pyrophosphohydrolase
MLKRIEAHAELELFVRALAFAADAHRSQRRKDGDTPYINHPIALVRVLVETGALSDPVLLTAAVLHDVVEDCDVSLADVAQRFGPEVAAVVAEVTDDKALAKQARKEAQVAHAPHMSARAKHLKLADKICNLTDILENPPAGWPAQRKADYFDWAARVVAGLRGTHPGLEARFDALYARRPNLE